MFSIKRAKQLHPGDWVIFRAPKHGVHPGPRARDIRPELAGEGYIYVVDKFWVVAETRGDRVVLRTRRGKVHMVDRNDPHLRPASLWERLFRRGRFPNPDAVADAEAAASDQWPVASHKR